VPRMRLQRVRVSERANLTKAGTQKVSAFCLWAVTLLSPFVVGETANAQYRESLGAGSVVRIRATPVSEWRRANVEQADSDSLAIRFCRTCESQRLAFADLQEVDRRAPGGHSHFLAGAGIGALVGVAALAVSISQCHDTGEGPPCAIGYVALPWVAVGGGLIGGLVGAVTPSYNWVPVYIKK
jgi:hypothetical protein